MTMMAKVKNCWQLALLCVLCFSTSIASAQSSDDDELRTFFGGVVAGANLSQVSGDGIEGYHKLGYNVGPQVYIRLDENIALSMELLVNEKGSRWLKGIDPAIANVGAKQYNKYVMKLPYAEIPILFNYFDKRKSNAGIGFSYGQLFREQEILDSANLATAFPFRRYDINLILNGNLMLTPHWGLNLRFNYSMLNIRKVHNPDLLHRPQQYSRLFGLRALYLF